MFIEYKDDGNPDGDNQLLNLDTSQFIYIMEQPSFERYSHSVRVCFSEDTCYDIYKGEILQAWTIYELITEAIQSKKPYMSISGHQQTAKMRDHLVEWVGTQCTRDHNGMSLYPTCDMLEHYNEFVKRQYPDFKHEVYPGDPDMKVDTFKSRIEFEGFDFIKGKIVALTPKYKGKD